MAPAGVNFTPSYSVFRACFDYQPFVTYVISQSLFASAFDNLKLGVWPKDKHPFMGVFLLFANALWTLPTWNHSGQFWSFLSKIVGSKPGWGKILSLWPLWWYKVQNVGFKKCRIVSLRFKKTTVATSWLHLYIELAEKIWYDEKCAWIFRCLHT